ncbi:hypothetical protein TNCT_342291, partial [Trichonephila clavata]
ILINSDITDEERLCPRMQKVLSKLMFDI